MIYKFYSNHNLEFNREIFFTVFKLLYVIIYIYIYI